MEKIENPETIELLTQFYYMNKSIDISSIRNVTQCSINLLHRLVDIEGNEKVNQLLHDLENGKKFVSQADSISEKEKLKITLEKLKQKLKGIENEIISLKETEIFTTINNITNWDNYFTETKTQLEEELQILKVELNN